METIVNNTLFTGKFLVHLPSVDSTNNYAKEYIANSSPIDGTVILADNQFAGRGQIGNKWMVEPNKNLTFSIVYNTSFLLATEQFYLNMAVSLGVWRAMEEVFLGCDSLKSANKTTTLIKWPNDILANNLKIAGILIENTISGVYLKHSIIGIGLNINQSTFPAAIKATSMKVIAQKELDRDIVLNIILSHIEKYYLSLKQKQYTKIKKEYLEHLFRIDELAHYKKQDSVFEGIIRGVEDNGNLIMETNTNGNSTIEKFAFKEISFII